MAPLELKAPQTLELCLGAAGTKAKWARIELKKLETLPGGGQANTFYDFVGQSPVKVWEADGEWSPLHNVRRGPFNRFPLTECIFSKISRSR